MCMADSQIGNREPLDVHVCKIVEKKTHHRVCSTCWCLESHVFWISLPLKKFWPDFRHLSQTLISCSYIKYKNYLSTYCWLLHHLAFLPTKREDRLRCCLWGEDSEVQLQTPTKRGQHDVRIVPPPTTTTTTTTTFFHRASQWTWRRVGWGGVGWGEVCMGGVGGFVGAGLNV